jgi:hypothetical protein
MLSVIANEVKQSRVQTFGHRSKIWACREIATLQALKAFAAQSASLAMTGSDRLVFHYSRHAERGGGDTGDDRYHAFPRWSMGTRKR